MLPRPQTAVALEDLAVDVVAGDGIEGLDAGAAGSRWYGRRSGAGRGTAFVRCGLEETDDGAAGRPTDADPHRGPPFLVESERTLLRQGP